MLKLNGPILEKTPHSRLLYKSFSHKDKLSLENLYQTINDLDKFMDNSLRIQKAHENLYLYFFGDEATKYWIGREVTGFIPASHNEFKVFDSYRGEVLTWELVGTEVESWSLDNWINHSKQFRSLAGDALALTWRVKVGPLEMPFEDNLKKIPQISFQFFKTH